MKKAMFLFVSFVFLSSCQNDGDTAASWPDNRDIRIETISLNGTDYAVGSDFMPIKDCPLTMTGSLSAAGRVELDFIWDRTDEVLSAVSAVSGNPSARIEVQQENVNDLWEKFTLTIVTADPAAEIIYIISAIKELPAGE